MRKLITIGCFDLPNCVRWESSAELGMRQVADISEPFGLNISTGEISSLTFDENGRAKSEDPIILSSTDGMFALGHYTYPLTTTDRYNFNLYSTSRPQPYSDD